jgi:hypothetical protein
MVLLKIAARETIIPGIESLRAELTRYQITNNSCSD